MFESYLIFTFLNFSDCLFEKPCDFGGWRVWIPRSLTGARDGSVSISELKTLESKAKIPKVRIQGGWVAKVD